MERPAVVVDQEYLKHLPGDGHPERPERVKVLLDLAARWEAEQPWPLTAPGYEPFTV